MRNLFIFLWICLVCACEQKNENAISAAADTIAIQENAQPVLTSEINEETVFSKNNNEFIIGLGQAGNIRKGMHASSLYQLFDSFQIRKSFNKSSSTPNLYAIYQTSQTPSVICLTTKEDSIVNIILQSIDYRTAESIGVGSSFAQLSKVYHVAQVYADKTSRVFVKVEELQKKQDNRKLMESESVQFELGFDATGLTDTKGNISVSAIPPNVKIISILL